MTPFGLRKIIKKMMGWDNPKPAAAPAKPRPSYPVTFVLPDGEEYQADAREGDSLVLTASRSAYPISTGCRDGTCGTCRVELLEGAESLTTSSEYENSTKNANDIPMDFRLGCQAGVIGSGVKVKIINVMGDDLVE